MKEGAEREEAGGELVTYLPMGFSVTHDLPREPTC